MGFCRSGATAWLTLCALLCAAPAWAVPDDGQQAWLDLVNLAPTWDNLKGGAAWVDGQRPTRPSGARYHRVRLQPGQGVTVRLPANESLRLYHPPGPLLVEEVDVAWSNGSGLFASLILQAVGDGHSLLARPPAGSETLVRVQRAASAPGPIELALFASHDPNRVVATSYPDTLIPLASDPGTRLDDRSGHYEYWLTDRVNPLKLDFDGPTRIRIDSRLLFPVEGGPYADSYRIDALVDGEPWRAFDLATLLETRQAVAVDGCTRPVGRPAYAYLDLPRGPGRLELRVRRPMLLRVQASRPSEDYLYAGNRPKQAGAAATTPASTVYRDAVRVARNNVHALGGISALQPLAELAERYAGQAEFRSMLSRRRILHTFYRDLMPQRPTDGGPPLFGWFHTPGLEGKAYEAHIPAGYAQSLAGNLASGFFSDVPVAIAQAEHFQVPEHVQSGQLRIAVDRNGQSAAATLFVQLDDAAPLRLLFEPRSRQPASLFRPTTGAVGLSVLAEQHVSAALTLSGAFAARRPAAPLIDAGFLELPLDRPIKRIKVWRDDSTSGPLRVALAYRTSDWYQMSESGYLDLLAAVGSGQAQQLLRDALGRLDAVDVGELAERDAASDRETDSADDLYQQWLPLLRFLHSRHAVFLAGVENGSRNRDTATPANASLARQLAQRAQTAEADGDWQVALEAWGRLVHASDERMQLRARSGQVRALKMLGSGFLAKQLLRHDLLYARNPLRREQALLDLVELAVTEEDLDALLTLRAVAAILDPTAANLQQLADALAATGHSRFALQVLLALPEAYQAADAVLALAYELGWWRLFGERLAEVDDVKLQALWRGYHAQLKGDFPAALAHWESAGERGAALANRLEKGIAIRHALDATDRKMRLQGVVDWEDWQRNTPSPGIWRDVPQVVTGHAGSRTVLSIPRRKFSDMFLATPRQPVRIGVYGPTRLRFAVRPLHDVDGEPINDWVRIASADREQHHPIIDNMVSAGLRLAAEDARRPGRRVDVTYEVGAGYHELRLNAARHDLLLGVASLESRFPLAVLPRLNPYRIRSVLAGSGGWKKPDRSVLVPAAAGIVVAQWCAGEVTVPLAPDLTAAHGDAVRVTSTAPSPHAFSVLRAYRADRAASSVPATGGTDAQPLQRRLAELLWQADQEPGRYEEILAEAEDLAAAQPHYPGVEPILRRLRRQTSWQLVRTADESAGVRLIEFSGWQPESPAMRTRKAVMALQTGGEQVLSGHDTRALTLYNLEPVEIGLRLSMAQAGHQPVQPMRVLVSWDHQSPGEVLLDAARPETTLREEVAAGNHLLRIRIVEPLANQFLKIKIDERRGDTNRVIAEPVQRSYMLATQEQPVVLLQRGPARLRIDEWRDGQTRVSYRTLGAGWQRVELPVDDGHEEALLRVFRLTAAPGRPQVVPRRTAYEPMPVEAPLLPQVARAPVTEPQEVTEPVANGWPGGGTWSLNAGLTSRRTVDDEPQASAEAERFVSLGAGYRWFSDRDDAYYQADGAIRLHEEGDPTLALRGFFSVRKPDWPVDLDLAGSLFMQHLDDTRQVESAATARARISRILRLGDRVSHRPSLSAFQRWLSLDSLLQENPAEVDQDIFTRYKHDHKRGLRLGERIQFQPKLDTLLYAGVDLLSNEDLNLTDPDQLRTKLGARQLLGDLDLEMRYTHIEYFADDDREEDSNTQRLRFDVGFGRWLNPNRGLQAGLSYEYDHDSGDSSVSLSLSLNRGNGRYYRDFRPGDLDFRRLRQRRALERQASEAW